MLFRSEEQSLMFYDLRLPRQVAGRFVRLEFSPRDPLDWLLLNEICVFAVN